MEDQFANENFDSRMNFYFAILNRSPSVKTIQYLLEQLQEEKPNDDSVNYNRIQRDIKKFLEQKKIPYSNPIDALAVWAKRHYMCPSEQDFFCYNGVDILYDYPNIYLKTYAHEAEKVGHHIREKYGHLCPFVIADYDTVLIRFKKPEKFNEFKDIFDGYLQVVPENEE